MKQGLPNRFTVVHQGNDPNDGSNDGNDGNDGSNDVNDPNDFNYQYGLRGSFTTR